MIRFHLDECIHHAIADGLLARGVDATTSTDAQLVSVPDGEQFQYAVRTGRVLITSDRDFLRIGAIDTGHPGIVFAHPMLVGIGDVVNFCEQIAYEGDDGALRGLIKYVPRRSKR